MGMTNSLSFGARRASDRMLPGESRQEILTRMQGARKRSPSSLIKGENIETSLIACVDHCSGGRVTRAEQAGLQTVFKDKGKLRGGLI